MPRAIREAAVDRRVLDMVQQSEKTEVTILSVGSGDLGQEYHINKLLTENGIFVQWLLVDPNYGKTDKSWDLLKTFKQSIEDTGSGVVGAYSDIAGYALFKLGKSGYAQLKYTVGEVFAKTGADLFYNHPLNGAIFNRKHTDFSSNPLPSADFVMAIDLTPTQISGYKDKKALTDLTLEAARYLDPEATALSVIKAVPIRAAQDIRDLEIELIEPSIKLSTAARFGF